MNVISSKTNIRYQTINEAKKSLANSSDRQRTCVAGPTNSGKTTFLTQFHPVTIEAYFTKGEYCLGANGNQQLFASTDPITWDNIAFYDQEKFINDWETHTKLNIGDNSPVIPLSVDPLSRQFYRDLTQITVLSSKIPYLCDIFLPQVAIDLIQKRLIDNLYLMYCEGYAQGQNGRLVRRLLRQSSGNIEFDLKAIALGQVLNGKSFDQLYSMAKNGLHNIDITFVKNSFNKFEVDNFVKQNIIILNKRNWKVSSYSNFSQIQKKTECEEWSISATEKGSCINLHGENCIVQIPIEKVCDTAINIDSVMKYLDIIYNFQLYTVNDVLSLSNI